MQVVGKIECKGHVHLQQLLSNVIAGGGEGLLLRKPQSHYGSSSMFLVSVSFQSLHFRKSLQAPFLDYAVVVHDQAQPIFQKYLLAN